MKAVLLRGLAAGAIGGLASALFIRFLTETQIGHAIGFENASHIGSPEESAMFARSTQHWGGMAAALIYGAVLGVVLAVVFAALHHRLASRDEFGRTIRLAVAAFIVTSVIPGMKYPPNPPTVGDPDTIGQRTSDYLLLLGVAAILTLAAFFLWQFLTERGFSGAPRFLLGGGAYVLAITLAFLIWPASPDAIVPPDNDAAPALQVSERAPTVVLDQVLETSRTLGDESIRDPKDPDEPMDLDDVQSGADLRGAPVAINSTKLVPHNYTTMVWHFRVRSFASLALLWAVIGTAFGFLLDRKLASEEAPAPAVS